MASMISYFGSCKTQEKTNESPSSAPRWDGNLDLGTNLNKFSPDVQLKILLEQSLACAYYLKFYGARCHELITEYISEVCSDVTFRFNHKCEKSFKDAYHKIFVILNGLVKFNRGGNWEPCCPDLVCEFLFDTPFVPFCPTVWGKRTQEASEDHRRAIRAFIMWMNKNFDESIVINDGRPVTVTTFTIANTTYNDLNDHHLAIRADNYPIGVGFSAMRTPLDEFDQAPILAFLSHFSWVGVRFETLVGFLTNFCLHQDMDRPGLSHAHRLGYCLQKGCLFPTFDVTGVNDGIVDHTLIRCRENLFQSFLTFLNYCVQTKGMTVVDRNTVAKAFGSIAATKEQRDSVRYLSGQNATPSADDFNAFKKVMGSVESLQLISQNPTLISAQSSQVAASAEETKPDEGKQDDKSESEKDSGKSEEAESDKKDPAEGTEGEDGDASEADEPGEDTDGPDEGDTTEGMPDDGSDSTDTEATGSSGEDSSTTDMQSGTPEEVQASDETGIELKFTAPDSETVDTVLFREEMDKFLANVLTNPPKCMSPQDVLTLLALKRYWLHCLSIETIKGIVEACIRLPKSIKNSVKSTE